MSEELTGYKLSRQWFDFCFENPEKVRPIHTAIYFFAIEHWNRLGKKRKFGFPSQMTMDAIGVKSYNTYIPAFRDIVKWGFFELIEKSKNQYSSNIIALSIIDEASDKPHDKALDKAFIKHSSKHLQSTQQSNCSIDKQLNNRTKNKGTREQAVRGTCYSFEDFWEDYDKKIEPTKTQDLWKTTGESERKAIKEFIPKYKAYEPDPQFRKNPVNFLKDRAWENDFIPEQVENGKTSDTRKVLYTYQEMRQVVDTGKYSEEDFSIREDRRDGKGHPMRELII